jgi:hypothetical protein
MCKEAINVLFEELYGGTEENNKTLSKDNLYPRYELGASGIRNKLTIHSSMTFRTKWKLSQI